MTSEVKFEFQTDQPKLFLVVGKPAKGKSFLVRNILYSYQKFDYFKFGIAFSGSKYSGEFDKWCDSKIILEYSDEKLENHITGLRKWMEANNKKMPEPNFIIFDDVFGKMNLYGDFLANWLACFRKTNSTIFFVSQYLLSKSTPPSLRNYVDYGFFFRTDCKPTIKNFYEYFGSCFENYNEFREAFRKLTREKYHSMMYVNSDEEEAENIFFSYMAGNAPDDFFITFKKKEKKSEGRYSSERKEFKQRPTAAASTNRWAMDGAKFHPHATS